MKASKFILTIFVLTILASYNRKTNENNQTVNAVIGDISYLQTFGQQPTNETDENKRLQTHLMYVETLLRNKDVSSLTVEQKENRFKNLDLLNKYWAAGMFPKNYDYPDQRIPCFIDKDGNICAVGYLIEQTAGRQVAEEINSKFKYEYLLAMNDQTIDRWVQASGLTKEECAMIQPAYGPAPTDNYISPAYGVSSSLMGGLSLSLNTINGIQLSKGANNKTVPILGLISGAGQITLGTINYPKEQRSINGILVNESQRNLSLINIGLGTSTMILSSWNLITNRKPKEKSLSWNLYSFPTQDSNMGLGFSLKKRL
ncbi:hypothetical protein GCM10027275_52300 [Rhabdobacter roseus]|uniref:Uncharacterized protein n=1 Tax=Rhabdobacter roseus TaxID=1655419 RepID=A0A840TVN3_9BACT|nr:hypothetical protein [Rhabdobacter roseus]MBB5287304.1 hypothetical protein [Rhabdobacter roseus]